MWTSTWAGKLGVTPGPWSRWKGKEPMATHVIGLIIPIRYKQEIQRLRKLVKTGDPQGVEAMPSSRPRRPRTRSH